MLKNLFLFLLLTATIYASSKVALYATSIDSNGTIVNASNGVKVVYEEYYLSADKAKYDKNSSNLELFGDIKVNYKGNYKLLGKYARMNLANKEKEFKPFYMLDTASEVWMSGARGNATEEEILLNGGLVSGCNPVDPLWKMAFSSSDYDIESMRLNIYNVRFYFYDIPVFYTPYFGYSLDTTRRTGLLMPSFGISNTEGFFYEQPIYIAEQNWWDIELKPQVRTARGYGAYGKFRFADSPVSSGEFKLGYFKENKTYVNSSDISLKNDQHYGIDFKYKNMNPLDQWLGLDLEGQSGIYTDIHLLNDVEYINLATNSVVEQTTSNQILSRLNGFYNTQDNYFGLYLKYYRDLELENNDNVLQQLPTLHYHHYIDSVFEDHLFYYLDIQSKNIYRNINITAVQTDLNLPVKLQTEIFDEYLNLSYQANFYMQHSHFQGDYNATFTSSGSSDLEDGLFFRNYHTLSASTQVTKGYEDFIHTMGLSLRYNRFSQSFERGYYKEYSDFCSKEENQNALECEFYNINAIDDEAYIDFTQYFYNSQAQEKVYHRISQKLSYETGNDALGELENELDYKITDALSIYNNTFYNYHYNRFTKVFNSLKYNNYGLFLELAYLFRYDITKINTLEDPYVKYITSFFGYDFNNHYSFFGTYNYDLEYKELKTGMLGFLYKKRCWDFGIKYSQNRRPVLNASGDSSSIVDRYIFLNIALKPFMKTDPERSFVEYKLSN